MKAVIFDTETTGLVANHTIKIDQQAEIIEFYGAMVDLENGAVLDTLHHFIKPKKALSNVPNFGDKKTITQITGITNEMLADKPPFAKVANEIEQFLTFLPFVIAHNVSFDTEMIDLEMERLKRKITWPRQICTVESTSHIKGARLSLTKLHEHLFGQPFPDAHRADKDTGALIRCCIELYKRGEL